MKLRVFRERLWREKTGRLNLITKYPANVYVIVACLLLSAPGPSFSRDVENQSTLYEECKEGMFSIKMQNAAEPEHDKEFANLASHVLLATSSGQAAVKPQILDSEKSEGSGEQNIFQNIGDGFYSLISIVGWGTVNEVVDNSLLNRDNRLGIPQYQAVLDVRPDFYLTFRELELGIKPRWNVTWKKWKDGVRAGESETDDDLFINGWLARLRFHNKLFGSYGRENLQWGPSYLLSPSNPFNQNNGRNEPNREIRGLDYGRLVWVPSSAWSISAIGNTGEGAADIPDFNKTYAIKLDYTGHEKFISLIPSYREGEKHIEDDEEFRLGFYAGWSVAEPLFLYTEGTISDKDEKNEILAGFAYTLEIGPTIAVEYFYQEDGCTSESIAGCFADPTADTTDILNKSGALLRKNYGFLQYSHSQIWDRLNITLRWIHGFDDNSDLGIGVFECELGNHAQVFFIGNYFHGDEDTEYGSFLDYSMTLGMRYTF